MNDHSKYATYRWLDDVQQLEPVEIQELNEIEQVARAIEETSMEHAELYTTS